MALVCPCVVCKRDLDKKHTLKGKKTKQKRAVMALKRIGSVIQKGRWRKNQRFPLGKREYSDGGGDG